MGQAGGPSRVVPTIAASVVLLATLLAGCGGPYAGDLDQGAGQTRTPPPPDARFVFKAGSDQLLPTDNLPVRDALYKTTGFPGAEPNIGFTKSGAAFVSAYDSTIRSTDLRTWKEVYEFAPILGEGGQETGDPMLWVDTVTDTVYASHMFPSTVCLAVAWSADEGETWTKNEASCTLPGLDHQKFMSAVPGPLAPPIAGQEHPTVLYQCYQRVADLPADQGRQTTGTTHCNMSYDGGVSWPAETLSAFTAPPLSCGGINGHPAAAADGTVFVPLSLGCDGLYVTVSLDSGLTWTLRPGVTSVGGTSIDPDLTFDAAGNLYALWAGRDHLTYLARSSDMGLTWAGPWRVSPPHITSTVFQVASAGAEGRLAMAFLGTDDSSEEPSFVGDDTIWHMYIATTEDGTADAPTFDVVQVTPDRDAVQVGCVWMYGGGNPCRNMLDFMDSAVRPTDGTFAVAFTKGCSGGCTDFSDKSSNTAVAWLPDWSLYGGAQ